MSDDFPDWLQKVVDHLRAVSDEMTPEEMAERIHEALQIAEAEKYATAESRFTFRVSGATPDDIAAIKKHLTPFENSIVEIERKGE